MISFSCQKEKRLNTLPSYTLDSNIHPLTGLHPKKRSSNYKVSSQNMKRKCSASKHVNSKIVRGVGFALPTAWRKHPQKPLFFYSRNGNTICETDKIKLFRERK
jgi:hypothetical protein